MATELDAHKRMRWNGHSPSHYEVWYATMNQLNSGAGFWIRYVLLAPRRNNPNVQVWFTSYVPDVADANVAVAQRYPIGQFSWDTDRFFLKIGACTLQSGRMTGMIDAGGTPVTWDLVFEPVTDALEYLPEVFYKTRVIHSKVLCPHPFMAIGGKIQIKDHSFILNGDPGQQGHAWGTRHPKEWIWFHCSSFAQETGDPIPGYVTGIAARQQIFGGLLLPPLSFGHLVWREKHLLVRPVTPWGRRNEGPWEWKGTAGNEEVMITLPVPWSEMVLAEYEDPAGHVVYCHHTDRTDCMVRFRTPRQPPVVFRSIGMAHLEIGSRTADPRAQRSVTIQS